MEKVRQIIHTKTFRQSIFTTFVTVTNGLLGIAFYAFTARQLGPASFGIFSIAILTITLIADIANVGTDTGIVRFVGENAKSDKNKALQFLKLGLKIKVLVGILIIVFGWIVIPFITSSLIKKPELTEALRYSLIGAFGALLFSFAISGIQALQKFVSWGILNISLNSVRFISIFILATFGVLSINNSLLAYIFFPFLGFLISLFLLPNFLRAKNENNVAKEFFHYNKWVAVFVVIAAISSRLDSYISSSLLTLGDVGIYSVAVGLSSIIPQIVFAIATVVAPKLATYKDNKEVITYLKKIQLLVIFLGVLGIIFGIPTAYFVIPLFYGQEFLVSIYPFIILLIAQVVFLISIPAHTSVFYYFHKPQLFVWISLGHLLLIATFGSWLIYNFGYMGAAYGVLAGTLFNFIVPTVWVVNKFRNEN